MTIYTKRTISHDEAVEIATRLINSHFNNQDRECARISIPANPERDDDLLILAYIDQQRPKPTPSVGDDSAAGSET